MANVLKHLMSSVKYDEGSFIVWAYTVANKTGIMLFINNVTADRSSKVNSV